jgi:hypothetical protein
MLRDGLIPVQAGLPVSIQRSAVRIKNIAANSHENNFSEICTYVLYTQKTVHSKEDKYFLNSLFATFHSLFILRMLVYLRYKSVLEMLVML